MSEKRIYEELKHYFGEKDSDFDPSKGQISFLILAALETEKHTHLGTAIVDPNMPNNLSGPPIDFGIAQQTLFYVKQLLPDIMEEAQQMAAFIVAAVHRLGKEKVEELVVLSDDAGDFIEKAKEEIEKHGTG